MNKSTNTKDIPKDNFEWLEDVTGDKSLNWVREKNAVSKSALEALPDFDPIRKNILKILDSKERIPYLAKYGKYYYNFWRDDKNKRGTLAADHRSRSTKSRIQLGR